MTAGAHTLSPGSVLGIVVGGIAVGAIAGVAVDRRRRRPPEATGPTDRAASGNSAGTPTPPPSPIAPPRDPPAVDPLRDLF